MQQLPEKPAWLNRVTVVGVGLLGGSVGMSLRRSGVEVLGYCRRESTCKSAVASGAVDRAFTDLKTACEEADVLVVASPVHLIPSLIADAADSLPADCLITDVGSTKAKIVVEVQSQSPQCARQLVAAHPIAGSEKTGVENASATLMDGKVVILTPTGDTPPLLLDRAREFWALTGSTLVEMSPELHDQRLAEVSHVPHLVSSLLASQLSDESKPLIGSGWADMTRVASGDPLMWAAICEHNREAILCELDRFASELNDLKSRLQDGDTQPLLDWLTHAKERKDSTVPGD